MIDFNLVRKILGRIYAIEYMLAGSSALKDFAQKNVPFLYESAKEVETIVFSGRGEERPYEESTQLVVEPFLPSGLIFDTESDRLSYMKETVAYCLVDIESLTDLTLGEKFAFGGIAKTLQCLNGLLYELLEFNSNSLFINAGEEQEGAWRRLMNAIFDENEHPRDEKGRFIEKAINKYIEDIRSREPSITKDVTELAKNLGVENLGLDFRQKTKHSTADKARRDAKEKNISPSRAVEEMSDLVRYTQGGTPQNLVENGIATLKGLKEKGYKVRKVKNFWLDPKNPYNGINVQMESPDKDWFEIQFNTPHNIEVKEQMHKEYEKLRQNDSDEEKERITKLMHEKYDDKWEQVDNIESFIFTNAY